MAHLTACRDFGESDATMIMGPRTLPNGSLDRQALRVWFHALFWWFQLAWFSLLMRISDARNRQKFRDTLQTLIWCQIFWVNGITEVGHLFCLFEIDGVG